MRYRQRRKKLKENGEREGGYGKKKTWNKKKRV